MKKIANIFLLTFLMNSCSSTHLNQEVSLESSQELSTVSKKESNMESTKIENEKVKIEIWSDVVCPFCFVGKRKIEQAITKLGAEKQVELGWHSFQLDPTFPLNKSMSTSAYLSERKGYPADQVIAMQQHLEVNGKHYGIDFQFSKALSFNTFDVHRLIQWSKTFNKSNELKEAFMLAFFTNGTDLSKQDNIIAVVEKTGLDGKTAQQILSSEQFKTEVENDIKKAQELGIRGVPFFLINGKEAISGAQDDQVFENTLSSALKNAKPVLNNFENGVCLPNGECK